MVERDRRIAEDILPDGKWVSTVRLPEMAGLPAMITHSLRNFETMVFPSQDHLDELDCSRYDTVAEARAGHAEMVRKWSGGTR